MPVQARWHLPGVAATHLVVFVALPLTLAARLGAPLREVFRLQPVPPRALAVNAALGAAAWAAAQALGILGLYLAGTLGLQPVNPYRALIQLPAPNWQLWLAVAVMPAVTEELAFRGLLLTGLEPLGRRTAWAVAGLLFALMHMTLLRLPALAVLGMILSAVALRTGSLLPGAVMHLVHNTLSLGPYWLAHRVKGLPIPADLVVPPAALAVWLPVGGAAAAILPALFRQLPERVAAPGTGAGPRTTAGLRVLILILEWWPLPLALILIAAVTWAVELAPAMR